MFMYHYAVTRCVSMLIMFFLLKTKQGLSPKDLTPTTDSRMWCSTCQPLQHWMRRNQQTCCSVTRVAVEIIRNEHTTIITRNSKQQTTWQSTGIVTPEQNTFKSPLRHGDYTWWKRTPPIRNTSWIGIPGIQLTTSQHHLGCLFCGVATLYVWSISTASKISADSKHVSIGICSGQALWYSKFTFRCTQWTSKPLGNFISLIHAHQPGIWSLVELRDIFTSNFHKTMFLSTTFD